MSNQQSSFLPNWLRSLPHGSPQYFYLVSSLFFGLVLLLVTAPFQSPDEPAHFLRIWQLSEGQLVADRYGGQVPISLSDCFAQFDGVKFHPRKKVPASTILREFRRPLVPTQRKFMRFANSAIYSPVPYIPQALAMFLGRHLLFPPIALMYAARLANCVAYALIGFAAIHFLPAIKWPACAILLSPLPIFLAGSMSADPLTIALSFLCAAIFLKLLNDAQRASSWLTLAFGVACLSATLCKWTYFTGVLLLAALPGGVWGAGARRWLLPISILGTCLAALWLWSSLSVPMHVPLRNGDPLKQLHWLESHPIQYLSVVGKTLRSQGPTLVWSSIGILGYLDTKLSPGWVGFYLLLILWGAVNDAHRMHISIWVRALAAAGASISIFLIFLCEYLVWNAPGASMIEGLQGRYFVPLALLALIVVRAEGRLKVPGVVWQVAIISSCLYTTVAVFCRYYVTTGINL